MSTKRIEQLIEDIYEFVESCKPQTFSSTKVIVPKDELYDLLDELRLKVPDEIKRCQKMIANRDAIMADAQDKAAAIEEEARSKAKNLINENEIMQQAYYQANEMIAQATAQAEAMLASANSDAEQIRRGALGYTNDMLSEIERVLSSAYEVTRAKSEDMLEALRQNLEIVTANRKELCGQTAEPVQEQAQTEDSSQEPSEEEYSFSEDTFLKNIQ